MAWVTSAKATYPVCRSAPTISGVDQVGRYARLNYGDWAQYSTQLLPRNYPTQQWQRSDTGSDPWTDISGATYPIYKRTSSDLNKYLRCKESRQASTGTVSAYTAATGQTVAESRSTVSLTTRGFKSLAAVGSMSTGTPNTLTLVSNPGFLVGDSIIIECGGEAGAGARGTVGVGGTWPAQSYSTTTAMNADTSKANGTFAWVTASGNVYQYSTGTSIWTALDQTTQYYIAKAQPLSLVATITAVSGTTITINGSGAQINTTSANVYFDNAAKMTALQNANGDSNTIFTFPAGTFYFGSRGFTNFLSNVDFVGAGKTSTILKAASRGAPLNIWHEQHTNVVMRDIGFVGNVADTTYGVNFLAGSQTAIDTQTSYIGSCFFHSGTGGIVDNCAFTNCWEAWQASTTNPYQWAIDSSISTTRQRVYIQWQSEQADSDYCGTINCSLTSDYLTSGFEFFRSRGCRHYSPTLVNATFAVNTAGDFDIFTPNVTIQASSQYDETSFSRSKPIIDINANIGISSGDGTYLPNLGGGVWYPTVVQQGYINANNDSLTGCNISFYYQTSEGAPNVVVYGGYPSSPGQGGLFQAPDYAAIDGTQSNGPRAVACDGDAYVIGIRAKGSPKPSPGTQANNINFSNGAGTAINCVADAILAATTSGNQTNAQFG